MDGISYKSWLVGAKIENQTDARQLAAGRRLANRPLQHIPAAYIVSAINDHRRGHDEILSGLRMRELTIVGDLRLGNYDIPFPLHFADCWFDGVLHLWQLRARTLAFRGCAFEKGADFRSSQLSGHLILRDGFSSTGPFIARDMNITGQVDITEAVFAYAGDESLELAGAAQGESFGFSRSKCAALYWRNLMEPPKGTINFRDAHVGAFVHDLDMNPALRSWPRPGEGQVILDGFRYERIDQCSVDRGLGLLRLQKTFSANSYTNLARGFKRLGLLQSAEDILSELKKREIASISSPLRRWLNKFTFGVIGYGKSPGVALILFLVMFLGLFALTYASAEVGWIEPSVNEMLLEPCFFGPSKVCGAKVQSWRKIHIMPTGQTRWLPPQYPEFSPLEYSMDSFFPIFTFDQRKYWEPSTTMLQILFSLISIFGIFLGGLFVGSVSGFLTPRVDDL